MIWFFRSETYFSLIKFNSARVEVALDCVPIRLYM